MAGSSVRTVLPLSMVTGASMLAMDLYLPAVPTLQRSFGVGVSSAQATVALFLAGLAASQLLWAEALARLGPRRSILLGVGLLAAGSVGCAVAPTIELLAFMRLLQGVAAGAATVVAPTVVRATLSDTDAVRGIAAISMIEALVPAAGPVLGAALLLQVGWRGLFWALGALTLLVLPFAVRVTPRELPDLDRGVDARYRRLLSNGRFLKLALSHALAMGALLTFVASAPYEKMFSAIPDQGKVAAPDPQALKRALLRGSILDGAAKEVEAFRRTLPAEDRARADAQLDAIRTLEGRLANGGERPAPGMACKRPTTPAVKLDPKATKTYPQLLQTSIDAVVAALACDLTRVVMLGCDLTQTDGPTDYAPLNDVNAEHALSHDYREKFEKLRGWYMEQVAYLLDRLAAIPEGDGRMLDNTIVLFATEISRGHTHDRMPFFTAGGRNLGVNVGTFHKLPIVHQNPFPQRSDKGYPHGRLFTSIINAMGLPAESFGIPTINKGPMDGYLKV